MAPRFSQFASYAAAVVTSASGITQLLSGHRSAASLSAADPLDYMDEYISGSAAAAASNSGTFVAKPVAAVFDSSGHQSDRYDADAWMHPRDAVESAAPVTHASGGAQPAHGQVFSVPLDSELQFNAHRRGDYMDQYIAELGGKDASAAPGDQAKAAKSLQHTEHADAWDFSWMHPRTEARMEMPRAAKLAVRGAGGDDSAGGQVINVNLDSELQFGARRGDYMDQYIADSGLGHMNAASVASGTEAAQGKQTADIDGSESRLPASSDFFSNFWRADHSAGGAAAPDLSGWTQPHFAAAAAPISSAPASASMEAQSAARPDHSQVINVKLDSELQEEARSRHQ